MSLSIQQEQTYVGHDKWKWSVWVDGSASELDQIDNVMYVLHPTFNRPVREVRDRATKFRLETSGWGTFTLHARAFFKDGREIPLDHELVLVYPDGTPTAV